MRRSVLLFVFALGVLGAACGGKKSNEPPVASPSVSFSKDRVALASPVKITYKFVVEPNVAIDGDYTVFVHVLDPEGEQLWTDDHPPEVPTSQWKPGQTVEYTRTVFVPNYPYIGEASVRVGLYSVRTGKRLALAGQELGRNEYQVAKFQLLPQSENIYIIYKDGWHPAEVAADNPASEWQWTRKTATVSFKNPKKDLTLYLEYDARIDLFTPAQQAAIRIGDQTVATFAADSKERKLLTFPVSAAQLGSGDMVELVLEMDKSFTPGGGDSRELGLRVFHLFVEPK